MLILTKKRLEIISRLILFSKGVRKYFVIIFVINLLLMQTGLVSPLLFKIFVDDVILGKNLNMLITVVVGYTIIYFFNAGINLLKTYASNRLFNRLIFNVRVAIWKNYMSMSFLESDKYTAGDLKMRIDDDTNLIEGLVNQQTYDYTVAVISFILNGVILSVLSWKLAIFSIIMVPITFLIGYILGKGENRITGQSRELNGKLNDWLYNSIQGWKEVKALTIEKRERRVFTNYFHKAGILNARWIVYWLSHALILPAIKDDFVMKFSLYFIGGLLVMNGNITIGSLLIFMRYYANFYNNVNKVNDCNISFNNDLPSITRMFEMLDNKIFYYKNKLYHGNLEGNIELNNITFMYEKGVKNVLENMSIKVGKGEKIAVAGKSGVGKSTIAKLLLGVVACKEGEIYFDKVNINHIHPVTLHKNIGVVMQDSLLFNMTIKENLQLAKYNATDDEIREACKHANIESFINELPERYDTLLGEKGVKLSGGQRQRMAIARIFLSNPQIIIFDEATSSLDNESERMIHDALEKLAQDKTVIIIAHRLSSILIADRVIVLKDGKVAGIGHHSELLGNNAAYDELFKEQYAIG